jgi:hypothetical protein
MNLLKIHIVQVKKIYHNLLLPIDLQAMESNNKLMNHYLEVKRVHNKSMNKYINNMTIN